MRKCLVLLVLLAGLAVGGVKGYLWYQVKSSADDFASAVAPFAEFSYEGIHTALTGAAGIDRLVIQPLGIDDAIRIQSVTLEAPDLRVLLTAGRSLKAGEMPRELAVSVRGLQIGTIGAIAELATAAAAQQVQASVKPLEGCGDRRIGLGELAQMGYAILRSDSRISYQRLNDRQLRVRIDWDAHDMAAGEVEFSLVAAGLGGKLKDLAGVQPRLEALRIRYTDQGYNQRLGEFCAERLKISPKAFAERQSAAARARLRDLGVAALDDDSAAALRQLFDPGSEAELVLAPPQPLDPAELRFYRPAQLIGLLQPRLTINGAPLALRSDPAAVGAPVAPAATQAAKTEASPAAPSDYRPVAVDELAGHVGWPVRMTLVSGRRLEGTLEAAGDGSVTLRRRFSGGSMSQPVRYVEIAEAAVRRP